MINWTQIKQLEEDVGVEDFGDVVELFLAEVDEAVESLPTLDVEDAAVIGPALHFLKGSAFNLGFQEFGEYCSQGEAASIKGTSDTVDIEKVASLYQQSKEAFFAAAADHCSYGRTG